MTWVLITGATAGIGKDAALTLARAGLRVIASGRSAEKLVALEAEADRSLRTVVLDVADAGSVEHARAQVDDLTGGRGVDVLVNNAGYGEMGPIETFELARVRAMFETNVIGLARVTRAFVPAMRARRSGCVVNVSSILGRTTIPAHGPYSATKHAVEALTDALRHELAPFGVSVVAIEPGSINTGFSEIAFGGLRAHEDDPEWGPIVRRIERAQAINRRMSARPEVVSRAILDAITSRRPKPRYLVPRAAAAQLFATRVAPRELYEAALRRAMGLHIDARPTPLVSAPKLALITGAGGGIGSASALRLAKKGLQVLATDADEVGLARVERAAKEARLPIETLVLDVTDARSIDRTASHVERRSEGRGLDVLINNAGYAELGPIELVTDDAWRAQLAVNVLGPLAVTQAFAPSMRRARRGSIVNVSSVAGVIAFPFMGAYCASKFALEALTDAMRFELGAFGVRVTAVQPAFIRSGFAERAKKTIERYGLDDGPYVAIAERMEAILARLDAVGGEPEDVARAIASTVADPSPRARVRAPFSAKVAAALAPWIPSALEDRALARVFETDRLRAAPASG